jgi:hypothetical protein
MSLERFKTFLETVPIDVQIMFAGFCEPWKAPECSGMVLHAFEKGHEISVYTTLMCTTLADLIRIKDVQFKCFVVHLIPPMGADVVRAWLKAIGIAESVYTETRHLSNCHNRAGNVRGMDGPVHQGPVSCHVSENKYDHNVLMPDGRVFLCCMDYGLRHEMGNLSTGSYEDLHRDKQYKLCRKCAQAKEV